MIFGGGVGLPGHEPKDMKAVVRAHMLKVYPELSEVRIDYAWGGTFCNTLSKLPDFGKLADNIFYAQGYTGHGVALASLGGKLLADVISGTAEQFDVLAAVPQHTFPGGIFLRTPGLLLGFAYLQIMDKLRALQK